MLFTRLETERAAAVTIHLALISEIRSRKKKRLSDRKGVKSPHSRSVW